MVTLRASSLTVLWGLFCACSWTWCIGMYLPRIMIDRWGWWGFIAFAAPNVIGCSAFGYIVANRDRSGELVTRHAGAMTWFSGITVAYHLFFVPFLFALVMPEWREMPLLPHAAAAVVFGLGLVMSFLPDRDWLGATVVTYGISLAALAMLGIEPLRLIEWSGALQADQLWWLTPTLFFGFLLCPYLDLTFHRALQRSPSRHAFAIFGVTFGLMLVLTCVIWFVPRPVLPTIALAHLVVQSVFTVGAHLREMRESPAFCCNVRRTAAMAAPLAATPLLLVVTAFATGTVREIGEGVYLRFLVFYGLVFPAYVLLFMAARPAKPARTRWIVYGGIVLASLPLYELGFIQGRTWLLALPLLAVLTAWAVAARRPRG